MSAIEIFMIAFICLLSFLTYWLIKAYEEINYLLEKQELLERQLIRTQIFVRRLDDPVKWDEPMLVPEKRDVTC